MGGLLLTMLELFCGIGGAAAAVGERARVVAAVDQHPAALATYRANFPDHPVLVRNLAGGVKLPEAELWWMSPPCQPYTVRGARRDLSDPRAQPLVALLRQFAVRRPPYFAMENVPTFARSESHQLVRNTLLEAGYFVQERELCPTALGVPFERRRFYLVASTFPLLPWEDKPVIMRSISDYLDSDPRPELCLNGAFLERYGRALHRVQGSGERHGACFTSAYSRSPVYCGSYLEDNSLVRHFSPEEVLRTLHFPATFAFSSEISRAQAYELAGNSLSVLAVQKVLSAFPPLEGLREAAPQS